MMNKYHPFLCLFFVVNVINVCKAFAFPQEDCPGVLLTTLDKDHQRFRELSPEAQNMLQIASIIAQVTHNNDSIPAKMNIYHVLLAALTKIQSANEAIYRLNLEDLAGDGENKSALFVVLENLGILRDFQRFLLKEIGLNSSNPEPFEFQSDRLLLLNLNEAVLTSIKIDYDEEFDRLWNLAIREKEEEIRTIHRQNGRILQLSNTENVVRYIKIRDKTKRYDKTFRIPTFPEHFFLASLHVDLPIFHFLSEYFDGKTPAQIKGTLYPLIDQAKQSFWNFSKKKKRNSHSKEEKAIITLKLEALFADHPGGLTLKQIKAGITEFANSSDRTIRNRLKENGYGVQGTFPGALWNHQIRIDKEKPRLRRKLETLFANHPGGLTFKQIKAGISEFANMPDKTIHNRLKENGYGVQGIFPGALWNHQIRIDEEKAKLRHDLEDLFADHPGGLTLKQIKAGITEFANISDRTIRERLKENGYEVQGLGPYALWYQQGHQTRHDEEKAIITLKLETLFADHPGGLTFQQIKDAGITEFDNISDKTIRNRLIENGYEAQGRSRSALWNHPTIIDEKKARLRRKLEVLFANHPGGLTFQQIKAGITEFANISYSTIRNRLKENGYEVQGRVPGALWHQQGHQTKKDEEKTIITLKLETLFADHPGGLTLKQIKDAGITEFDNISDKTIRNRLIENGYEAQRLGPGALWKKRK